LQSEKAPRKTRLEDCRPFIRVQAQHRHSILKAIPRLEIATNTVTNATNISFSLTENSGLVAMKATAFLCVDDQ